MPHTPLLSAVSDLASRVAREERLPLTRRTFLGASLAAASATRSHGQTPQRIVVVGAGLAGLTCAYRLQQQGIAADVYDAGTRAGGRCWTLRGAFDEGQIVERGGELIDQAHAAIRQLCQELRLDLDNLLAAEPNGSEPFYSFDGKAYPYQQAVDDLKSI